MVPKAGIEPAPLAGSDFESDASTNSTTWAFNAKIASINEKNKNGKYLFNSIVDNGNQAGSSSAALKKAVEHC